MAFCIFLGKQPSGEAPSQVVRENVLQRFPSAHFSQPHPDADPKDRKSCIPRVLTWIKQRRERSVVPHKIRMEPVPQAAQERGWPEGRALPVLSAVFGRVVWAASFHRRLGPELHICQSGISRMLTCLSQN